MTNKETIQEFISQRTLAIVGVSRQGQGFGNMAMRELKTKGYTLYPVHPSAETLEGERCYPNLASLPEKVGGVLVVVPPAETEKVVKEAQAAGIPRAPSSRCSKARRCPHSRSCPGGRPAEAGARPPGARGRPAADRCGGGDGLPSIPPIDGAAKPA